MATRERSFIYVEVVTDRRSWHLGRRGRWLFADGDERTFVLVRFEQSERRPVRDFALANPVGRK